MQKGIGMAMKYLDLAFTIPLISILNLSCDNNADCTSKMSPKQAEDFAESLDFIPYSSDGHDETARQYNLTAGEVSLALIPNAKSGGLRTIERLS